MPDSGHDSGAPAWLQPVEAGYSEHNTADTVHVQGMDELIPQLLTPEDLSELLSLSVDTLRDWRTKQTGPAYAVLGKHVRYDPADVRAWLQAKKKGAA